MCRSKTRSALLLLAIFLAGWLALPVSAQDPTPLYGPLPLPEVEPITRDNVDQLQQIAMLGSGRMTGWAWSPDGQVLAVSSAVGVWLFSAADWHAYPEKIVTTSPILGIAYSPNGRWLFGVGKEIHVWSTETWEQVSILEGGGDCYRGLTPSLDGTLLAALSCITSGPIYLWHIDDTGQTFTADFLYMTSEIEDADQLIFSADGTTLYARTKEWISIDTAIGEIQLSPEQFSIPFDIQGVSPNHILIAGAVDNHVEVWNWPQNRLIQILPTMANPWSEMLFSMDNENLIIQDYDSGHYQQWNIRSGRKIRDLPSRFVYGNLLLQPGGALIAYSSWDWSSFEVWSSVADKSLLYQSMDTTRMKSPQFAGDGTLVYANEEYNGRALWYGSLETGNFRALPNSWEQNDRVFVLNPSGEWLVTGGTALRLWYLPTRVLDYLALQKPVYAIDFHPNGKIFATGSDVIRLWDFETRKIVHYFGDNLGNVTALTYTSDGSRLASAHDEDGVYLWDMTTYQPLLTLEGFVGPLVFSPDDQQLVVSECWEISRSRCSSFVSHVVDSNTGEIVYTVDSNTGEIVSTVEADIYSPVFSPDGQLLIGGDSAGNLLFWDAATGELLARYRAHHDPISVGMTADQRFIVTGLMPDGLFQGEHIRVWGVPKADE